MLPPEVCRHAILCYYIASGLYSSADEPAFIKYLTWAQVYAKQLLRVNL